MNYFEMSKEELDAQLEKFKNEYAEYKKMNLNLDMSRGKPGDEQPVRTVRHSTELTAVTTVFWTAFPE